MVGYTGGKTEVEIRKADCNVKAGVCFWTCCSWCNY